MRDRAHLLMVCVLAIAAMGSAKPWKARGQLVSWFQVSGIRMQPEYVQEVVDLTELYSRHLCLQDELDTLLANWTCESGLDMMADDGEQHGIAQVLKRDRDTYRAFWRVRGIELPDDGALETQVAMGVAAWSTKLRAAQGDVWEACRRYNGAGPRARRHAEKVMRARAEIFGRPYMVPERRDHTECGRRP